MAFIYKEKACSGKGDSCMMKNFKPHRLVIFVVATVALANFFEAGRLISSEMTFRHVSTSVLSLLLFIFALFVLGYWVYSDEKGKNNLRVKFGMYEWLYKKLINNVKGAQR
jgi:hypothetical protein